MLKILGRNTSANVQKVLWCCGELSLAFQREDIGGPFGGNQEADYLALNPNGLVPTMIEDGLVLWESNTITRYLAAMHDAGGLLPAAPKERALAERWMDWQLSVLGPAIHPVFWGLIRTLPEKRDMQAIEAARVKLAEVMAILDRYLGENDYVSGSTLTVGDIPVGIMTYRWFALDIERPELPNLRAWYDRLTQRPPYQEHIMNELV